MRVLFFFLFFSCAGQQEVLPELFFINAVELASVEVIRSVNASERSVFPTEEELRMRSYLTERLLDEGEYNSAQAHLNILVQARPTWWSNHLSFAKLQYYSSNRIDLALEHVAQCLELAENMLPCLTLQGQLLRDDGQYEAALSSYIRALELVPGNPDIWEPMSRIYLSLGLFDEAQNVFLLLFAARSEDISVRLLGANIAENSGDFIRAEEYFIWISTHHADSQIGLTYLMRFYTRIGNLDAASEVREEIEDNIELREQREMRAL